MSGGTTPARRSVTRGRAEFDESGRPRGRRRAVVLAVVLGLIAAGVVAAVVSGGSAGSGGDNRSSGNGSATSLASVTRQLLSTRTQFNATLGYAGSYTVLGQVPGTMTWLPKVGAVIGNGQVLYRVDQVPVVLLYGRTPAYRTLAEGAADVTGADVAQLNHDLVALGYVDATDVHSAWDEFNWATRTGVEKLQDHLGVQRTGSFALGEVVFLPTAARVTTRQAALGAPATGPVLTASSTVRTVSLALEADLQAEVRAGDRVTITLPGGRTTPGRVRSVGTVATVPAATGGGGGGSERGPTVPVHIRLLHPHAAGSLDQALVEVAITDRTVSNVLAVNVTALLARSGGGYAVEVVAGDGTHHLVSVTPGVFDDTAGMVQVSGSGLAAGQRVVVPGHD